MEKERDSSAKARRKKLDSSEDEEDFPRPQRKNPDESSSSSSESESGADDAYIFRDTESTLQPVKLEENNEEGLKESEKIEEPKSYSTSKAKEESESSSSEESESEEVKDKHHLNLEEELAELNAEEFQEKTPGKKAEGRDGDNLSSNQGTLNGNSIARNILTQSDHTSNSRPEKALESPNLGPAHPSVHRKSESSESSSSKSEDHDLGPSPLMTLENEEIKSKPHPFSDISSIDIYGGSHFVNVNDKSDYSIEVSHNPIEFEEEGRKSSIRPKNSFSGSEEDTLQELQALETALSPEHNKKDSSSSSSSSESHRSELDKAIVIENSDIQAREESDSDEDNGEILKKIQAEPAGLDEENFQDVALKNVNDPLASKIPDHLEVVKEESRKQSSSSSSSFSSEKQTNDKQKYETMVIKDTKQEGWFEQTLKADNEDSLEDKELDRLRELEKLKELEREQEIKRAKEIEKEKEKEKEKAKLEREQEIKRANDVEKEKAKEREKENEAKKSANTEGSSKDKQETKIKSGNEINDKYTIGNTLIEAKKRDSEQKKPVRDSRSNRACANCLVF